MEPTRRFRFQVLLGTRHPRAPTLRLSEFHSPADYRRNMAWFDASRSSPLPSRSWAKRAVTRTSNAHCFILIARSKANHGDESPTLRTRGIFSVNISPSQWICPEPCHMVCACSQPSPVVRAES
jgi:hypothetical protein